MNIFLQNLDQLLRKRGKRRTWLAEQSDIPLSTINSWFSRNILPRLDDAFTIAKLLQVSLDFLVSGKGLPTGNDPVLHKIVDFLQEQDHENLKNIEAGLTLFNYMNLTQNIISAPALMLDNELHVTWINDTFLRVLGNGSDLKGVPLLQVADKYLNKEEEDAGESSAQNLLPIPVKKPMLNFLNNIILIPVYKSYRAYREEEIPLEYAGIFIDVNKEHKNTLNNIFLKLAEISLRKENYSIQKLERIKRYTEILAEALIGVAEYPEVNEEYIENLSFFAPMHDIGKIGIPDDILNKQGKLEHWEMQLVKEHTKNGAFILSAYPNSTGREIALQHHEKWDGSGYPYGLSGLMISLAARIVAICVTYDALRSEHAYRKAMTHKESLKIIKNQRGLYFEPLLVDKFLDREKTLKKIVE